MVYIAPTNNKVVQKYRCTLGYIAMHSTRVSSDMVAVHCGVKSAEIYGAVGNEWGPIENIRQK